MGEGNTKMLEHEESRQKRAYFPALISVTLTLGPSLAHLLELPNKIGLDKERYFIVQGIYRGWALLGIVVVASLASKILATDRVIRAIFQRLPVVSKQL